MRNKAYELLKKYELPYDFKSYLYEFRNDSLTPSINWYYPQWYATSAYCLGVNKKKIYLSIGMCMNEISSLVDEKLFKECADLCIDRCECCHRHVGALG